VRVVAVPGAGPLVSSGGGVAGVVGEADDGPAEALVAGPAGPAEAEGAILVGGAGDGRDAGLGGEVLLAEQAGAVVAQLGQDQGSVDSPGARGGRDDGAAGMGFERMLNGCGDALDLGEERLEHGDECGDELAAGVGFGLARETRRRAAQALEQLGDGTLATVDVAGQEGRPALLPEALGALRGRLAAQEGERNGRVDIGEDGAGAPAEAFQERAELVGEPDALSDEVVRVRTRARRARVSLESGRSGWKRRPSLRRRSASMKASPRAVLLWRHP
jgi:hypothetical protein